MQEGKSSQHLLRNVQVLEDLGDVKLLHEARGRAESNESVVGNATEGVKTRLLG